MKSFQIEPILQKLQNIGNVWLFVFRNYLTRPFIGYLVVQRFRYRIIQKHPDPPRTEAFWRITLHQNIYCFIYYSLLCDLRAIFALQVFLNDTLRDWLQLVFEWYEVIIKLQAPSIMEIVMNLLFIIIQDYANCFPHVMFQRGRNFQNKLEKLHTG